MSDKQVMADVFEIVSSEDYDGRDLSIIVNASTTQNVGTVIEQSQEDDYRTMTMRELNRRFEKLHSHFRVDGCAWVYSNEKAPAESTELEIKLKMRPVGVEDL